MTARLRGFLFAAEDEIGQRNRQRPHALYLRPSLVPNPTSL